MASTTDGAAVVSDEELEGSRAPGLGPVLAGLAGLWGLLIGLRPLYDNSFLTHLATGRLILDQGSIPGADPYSFTAAGRPWVVQSWLASVIYAVAEDVAGLDGIRLVHGVLGLLLGLAVWRLTARSESLVVRTGVTGAVLLVGSMLWTGRPLLYGLLGVAAALLVADGRLDRRWLIPVGWIWVNTHGSFPLALVLLGALAVGARLDRGSWGDEIKALGWMATGLAAGAINPIGPKLLVFPLSVGTRTDAFRSVIEWQPPRYEEAEQYLVAGLLLLGVLALVRVPRWRNALPLVAFAGLAMTSARNQGPLILVLTPILAGAVVHLGPDLDRVRRPVLRPALAMVVVLGFVFTMASLRQPHSNLDAYPVDAVEWMEDHDLWGPEARVVSRDFVGNYRELRRGDEARVFIDDRVDMYPISLIEDYRVLLDAGPGWDDVLDRHRATAVLWEADTPLGAALAMSPDWDIVHQDAPWVVAVRK